MQNNVPQIFPYVAKEISDRDVWALARAFNKDSMVNVKY